MAVGLRRGADSGHERAAVRAGRAWAAWRATLAVPHSPTGAGVWRIEAISGRENTVACVEGRVCEHRAPHCRGQGHEEGGEPGWSSLCGPDPGTATATSAPGGPRALLLLERHAHLDFPSIFVALKFKLSR